jgi:hypothetical protein
MSETKILTAEYKRNALYPLAAAVVLAFVIDFVLGTRTAFHTGPYGVMWLWTPGLTLPYLVFVWNIVYVLRGR